MTKGICDLHKFLHKAQVRLTQAGSLMYRGLRIMHKFPSINKLDNFYFAQYPPNRFRARPFCAS